MQIICWVLVDRTPEMMFISSIFHLLLAGLTFVVLLYQMKKTQLNTGASPDWFLPSAFLLLMIHFGLLVAYFGASFFFHVALRLSSIVPICHLLITCSLLLISGSYLKARSNHAVHVVRWVLGGCAIVSVALFLEISLAAIRSASRGPGHSPAMFFADLVGLLAVSLGIKAVVGAEEGIPRSNLVALSFAGLPLFLHVLRFVLPRMTTVSTANVEEHLFSIALIAFAWSVGERSQNLVDRVFVRLNLAFIILASLLMGVVAGMQKDQYLKYAADRSKNLAEFLGGHIISYEEQGEELKAIVRHSDVRGRLVAELGNLRELREIRVDLGRQRAIFRRDKNGTISEEVRSFPERFRSEPEGESPNTFQMFRFPLRDQSGGRNEIQFLGTTEFINQDIGKYIAVIYASFTIVVMLASLIIGLIVTDADKQLRRQYAELEKNQRELAQAAKLASVGELAAGLAHEINNPITSVLSLASHLTDENGTVALAPAHRRSLLLMAQQAERVSKIVQNLLIFARKSHLQLSWVDVAEQLESAISLVQYRLAQILLVREIEPHLPPILGDPGRLTEVFVNLLNNAIDAMPARGTLVVRAVLNPQPQSGVRIEVSDNGCGIPPEQIPRIFDPFFTTKPPGRGTGLGLSISHGIVRDHHGQIWAQKRPGGGTTFVVILPKEAVRDELTYTRGG